MSLITSLAARAVSKNRTTSAVTLIGIVLSFALMFSVMMFADSFIVFYRDRTTEMYGPVELFIDRIDKENAAGLVLPPQVIDFMRTARLGIGLHRNGNATTEYEVVGYDPAEASLLPFSVVDGRLPERAGEAIVSESFYSYDESFGVVGDRIQADLFRRKAAIGDNPVEPLQRIEGERADFTIVGISKNNPFSTQSYQPVVYVAMAPADVLAAPVQQLRLRTGVCDVATLKQALNALNEGAAKQSLFSNDDLLSTYPGFTSMAKVLIYSFATVFLIIVGLAGIGLVQNAFLIAFTRRARELSLLSSVGMTSKQRSGLAFTEGFMLYIVALPLGLIVAFLAMTLLYYILNPLMRSMMDTAATLRLIINPLTALLIAGLGLLVVFIGSILPVLRSRRLSPIAGIRQQSDIKLTAKALRVPVWLRAIGGFESELAWKNMKRNKKPFRATLVSLVFSLVLYLTLASVLTFAGQNLRRIGHERTSDIVIRSTAQNGRRVFETKKALEALLDRPDIASSLIKFEMVAELTYENGEIDADYPIGDTAVFGRAITFDAKTMARVYQEIGLTEPLKQGEALLLNRMPLRQNDRLITPVVFARAPQDVKLTPFDDPNRKPVSLKVARVVDEPLDAFMEWNTTLITFIVSEDTLSVWSQPPRPGEGRPWPVSAAAFIQPESADYQDLLKELKSAAREQKLPYQFMDEGKNNRQAKDVLRLSQIILFGFATVIGLIGVLNLYNSLIASLQFRRQEFALLRAVGMSDKSTSRMVRIESLFYALKLLVFGIPLAAALSYVFYLYLNQSMQFAFTVPVLHYAVASVVTAGLVYLLMQLGTKLARRGIIAEELKRLSAE